MVPSPTGSDPFEMKKALELRAALTAAVAAVIALICAPGIAASASAGTTARGCMPNPQTRPAQLVREFLVADVERRDLRHGFELLWPGSFVRTISCGEFLTGSNEVVPFLAIDWRRSNVKLLERRPRARTFTVMLVSRRRDWSSGVFRLELTRRGRYWRVSYWAPGPVGRPS